MDLSMGGVEMGPERLAAALEDYLPKLRWLAACLAEIRAHGPGDGTMIV
jgi:hypothetical protein